MTYQIDQSGKIEQTNKDTIIVITNAHQKSVMVKAKAKRIIKEWFRENSNLRFFPYFTFAALVAIIIRMKLPEKKIMIDKEYPGHEDLILQKITVYLKLLRINKYPPLEWSHVGKTSKAHNFGIRVGRDKTKIDKVVSLEEIMELLLELKNDRDLGNPRLRTT